MPARNISPAMENYLEGILVLRSQGKKVRVKDLAGFLNVKASSVVEAMAALEGKGLVVHERYGRIELTPEGSEIAMRLYRRHCTLKDFFSRIMGVREAVAEGDACKVEHYLSRQTMNRIIRFMDFVDSSPAGFPGWLEEYHRAADKGDGAKSLSKSRSRKRA